MTADERTLEETRDRALAAPASFELPDRFRGREALRPPRRAPAAARLTDYFANGRRLPPKNAANEASIAYANRGEGHRGFLPPHTKAGVDGWFVDVLPAAEHPGRARISPWVVHRQTLRPARQEFGFTPESITPPRDTVLRDNGRHNQLWVQPQAESKRAVSRRPTLTREVERLGRVLAVRADRFIARVDDPTAPGSSDRVEFYLRHVAPGDLELVQRGAQFTWVVGYRDEADGSRLGVSIVQFVRVPARWTTDQLLRAEAHADQYLRDLETRR